MGIPSYFTHIVRQHRKIIKSFTPSTFKINNLYLDCNSFIYEAQAQQQAQQAQQQAQQAQQQAQQAQQQAPRTFEQGIIHAVCEKLVQFIGQLKPNKRVFIAFDGVAPMAKLNQQRNRRYMSAFQAEQKWNTSAITPGTQFMGALSVAVRQRFAQPQEFGLDTIVVSASDEHGEGEHKIYQYIRADAAYHKGTCTVIYGLDADLIMLTLNHLHISDQMYLFRETPEFIKSVDKTLNPNETYMLDIPLMAKGIATELAGTDKYNPDVVFDYIFLCFFLGNDFLPHFPALNIRTKGIERLTSAYKQLFQGTSAAGTVTLTHNRQIIWKNVRLLINHLAQQEQTFLLEEYAYREKFSKNMNSHGHGGQKKEEDENLLLPLKERAIEVYINPRETGWEARYYRALFKSQRDLDRRGEISTNYLEGLEWTLKYYSTGCADWRWTYNYYYPPLLGDLIKYVPYFDHTFVPEQPERPVAPLVQLSYVLPPSSMDLLPAHLKETLLLKKPEWYVGNYFFHWAFCKFFWEAHVDLPQIDMKELEEIVREPIKDRF